MNVTCIYFGDNQWSLNKLAQKVVGVGSVLPSSDTHKNGFREKAWKIGKRYFKCNLYVQFLILSGFFLSAALNNLILWKTICYHQLTC